MKNLFATSDWHCYQDNVIKFCNRPYKDIDHMHEVFIRNYNSTVNPGAVCYFLGDMGFGHGLDKIIARLNEGPKILILGNHDKHTYTYYYRCGFSAVMHEAIIYIGRHRVTLSHCPLRGIQREDLKKLGIHTGENWHGENRLKSDKFAFRTIEEGDYHLHGHIHSPNGGASKRIVGNQFDVGMDANNYRPVSGSTIEGWIARNENKKRVQ